jgi:hypothetical protein
MPFQNSRFLNHLARLNDNGFGNCQIERVDSLYVDNKLKPSRRLSGQLSAVPDTYSMIWSAKTKTDSGMLRFKFRAVRRLMASSNSMGCDTGKDAGFVPRSI